MSFNVRIQFSCDWQAGACHEKAESFALVSETLDDMACLLDPIGAKGWTKYRSSGKPYDLCPNHPSPWGPGKDKGE
jgi:hypothetical protein